MAAAGYFGRALIADASDGSASALPLPDELLRAYLGGAGLGAWLMHRLAPPGVDPLGAAGTAGVRVLPARRHAADHQRQVRCRRQVPAHRHVERRPRLEPFRDLRQAHRLRRDRGARRLRRGRALAGRRRRRRAWRTPRTCGGCRAAEAEARLRERLGRGWRVAAIGPAGERGVRYATVSHDGRHAGRGGLGAVMGAKRLKAIAVRAATKVASADPKRVLAAARDLRALLVRPGHRQVPGTGHAGQPARIQRHQHPAHPQLPGRHVRRSSAACRRGAVRVAQRGAQQLRVVHHRLRAHLLRSRRQEDAGRVRERLRARPAVRGFGPRSRARGQRPV